MICNVCRGTGFMNIEQVPDAIMQQGVDAILEWVQATSDHDVCVCGDGENWYGTPGEHYTSEDPVGKNGPYASNGGLCKCH